MLVLVFVECSDHQLKYKQFKSEILAVQKSIKISIRRVVIILILKCVAQNQHVTPWNWKKIFPVTTMFIQKLRIAFRGQDKMVFTWKMFPFSNSIFIKRVQLNFFSHSVSPDTEGRGNVSAWKYSSATQLKSDSSIS